MRKRTFVAVMAILAKKKLAENLAQKWPKMAEKCNFLGGVGGALFHFNKDKSYKKCLKVLTLEGGYVFCGAKKISKIAFFCGKNLKGPKLVT